MTRLHPIDLIRVSHSTVGFDDAPDTIDLSDSPLPSGNYERELGSLDLGGDGGVWEPLYAPAWFVATCWFLAGVIAGIVAGLWRATW